MDWEILAPGLAFLVLGALGVLVSLAGVARTFMEGLHSLALFVMIFGVIFSIAGLLKDGPPKSARGRALFGMAVTFVIGVAVVGGIVALTLVPSGGTEAKLPASESPTITQIQIVEGAYLPNQPDNYVPKNIVIVMGVNNTVNWTNRDTVPHTVTSDTGLFDSGKQYPNFIPDGASWKYTFINPGTYPYHCTPHPWMKGTVTVK